MLNSSGRRSETGKRGWIDFRWSYLPPLMVYLAYGISAITGISNTYFVKEQLGFTAEFMAGLAFWLTVPWTLKVPIGHLVDLLWKHKALLIYLGALLVAVSLYIMTQIVGQPDAMRAVMPLEDWFVIASLLAPVGYVLQDAVADAMTVEAVPRVDGRGEPLSPEARRAMNTTVQTLGRIAIVGGGALVGLLNMWMFSSVEGLDKAAKLGLYLKIYQLGFVIPLISVLGVILAAVVRRRRIRKLEDLGHSRVDAVTAVDGLQDAPHANLWILGGGLAFALVTVAVGLLASGNGQEIVFVISSVIVAFLMWTLLKELEPNARATLLGTAIIIFMFRAVPSPGEGVTWWMIDILKFDQGFLSELSFISSLLALMGLFAFRHYMGAHSIVRIVVVLSVASFVLSLPSLGMYYGLHEWTSHVTNGYVDAKFIALVNTALESPLGQVSMVPMLAWIANSAPAHLKATFFAVMASFTNLALTASQLGSKYLNKMFVVSREVVDATSHTVTVPADYSELGVLLWIVLFLTLAFPIVAILVTRLGRLQSA